MATLGARVIAVDKAPLDPKVVALGAVEERRESAFALDPEAVGPVDWLFSDVVCYPRRLLGLVRRWVASGLARRMICTIKFQGEADMTIVDEFRRIEGASVRHLFHNKHELTWSWRAPSR
jgi:23S rRNA (cytidine2498-2'-O)-methyltransferase